MAQIVHIPFQTSPSITQAVWPFLRHSKFHQQSENSRCSGDRKCGFAYSISSNARTKEPYTSPSSHANRTKVSSSPNGLVGESRMTISLQAKITIRNKRNAGDRDEQMIKQMDVVADILGQNITLQLVSVETDPVTNVGKRSQISSLKDWSERTAVVADKVQYTADFVIGKNFGTPGALIITNRHQSEFFLESIALNGHPVGTIHFATLSWVHSARDNPVPRVFFSNQVYLPSSTPKGLQDLREQDLKSHRGDGKGVRQEWENIYDYDVYNDLCDVEKDHHLRRPVLGGSKGYPYPRRNRTGRIRFKTDCSRESRVKGQGSPYVPRDEAFEQIKEDCYFSTALRGLVHRSVPDILDHFLGSPEEFESFEEIDRLYGEGITIQKKRDGVQTFLEVLGDSPVSALLPGVIRSIAEATTDQPTGILRYPLPQILSRDKFAWLRDDEFGRQALAGLNPCAIRRLETFPPISALEDENRYGPKESAIKAHHIEDRLDGLSIDRALNEGKLFILDYHEMFIPFINRINSLSGQASYASRTIFFLTLQGVLKPLVIELSLPPPNPCQQVFVPGNSATEHWLWTLAKAHVSSNDAGYHQLGSHWVRTHACTEPYVIATHRQLSPLHPIFKLLYPHFRYTLEINAAARQSLISADGVIEKAFLPGLYSMEMSSAFYDLKWRFDEEALPQDLISRGVAVEDPASPCGVKLLIEDYPFATDGLLVWSCINSWVLDYVSIYYKDSESIQNDCELKKWWEEVRTCGHADKKDEEWWPKLENPEHLVQILTTIMWVNSGLHAAVNFGQFAYAGYMPNKPTLMRKFIPQPNTPEYKDFMANPQAFLLSSLPGQVQSTVLMAVIESLSTHSPDEEYLGSNSHPQWLGCPEAIEAFRRFQQRVSAIEHEIQGRNANPQMVNRNGAGILPYDLLLPWSPPGITGRGIPNSISI